MIHLLRVTGKKKNRIIKTQNSYYKNGSSFDYKAASLYLVAIHEDSNGFSLGYANPKTGDVLGVEHLPLDTPLTKTSFDNLFKATEAKLKLTSSSKNTYYSTTSKFTIVPSVFFDEKLITASLESVVKVNSSELVFSKFVPEIDSHIIFAIDKSTVDFFKSKWPVDFSHHGASLITTYSLYYTSEEIKSVFVQYHNRKFSLALFDKKKLILFNVFDFNSVEDIIYYLYYTMEQYGFSPKDTALHLGGYFTDNEKVISILQKYSGKIFHLKPHCCTDLSTEKADAIINTIFDLQCG